METMLVTGAARGIGAAVARELGGRGYHVVVNHRGARHPEVVAEIEAAGGSASAAMADVTDADAVAAMVADVVAAHGRIDGLVVAANSAPPPFAPLAELDWPAFAAKLQGELAGAFHVTKQVTAVMRAQKSGRIVFVGSTAADYVGGGRLAHGTAKAALAAFARHVAAETALDGIGVLTVAPGAVRGPAVAALAPAAVARLGEQSVLGRMVEPTDVAATVAMALDPGLRAATGSVLRVDGGWSVLVGGPRSG